MILDMETKTRRQEMQSRYLIESRQVGMNGELTRWVVLDTETPRTGEGSARFPHTVVDIFKKAEDAMYAVDILNGDVDPEDD